MVDVDMRGRGDMPGPASGPGVLTLLGARRLSSELGGVFERVNAASAAPFCLDEHMDVGPSGAGVVPLDEIRHTVTLDDLVPRFAGDDPQKGSSSASTSSAPPSSARVSRPGARRRASDATRQEH
jgi:hypothetical protein